MSGPIKNAGVGVLSLTLGACLSMTPMELTTPNLNADPNNVCSPTEIESTDNEIESNDKEIEKKFCLAINHVNTQSEEIQKEIKKLLNKRDENNSGILAVTLGLVGIGVASSPPNIDVTKSLAGVGSVMLTSKQYNEYDTQMIWYLQMNDALMCVKYNTLRLQEAVKKKEESSDLDRLIHSNKALQDELGYLRLNKSSTQDFLTNHALPYGTVFELLEDLTETHKSAMSVIETIRRAPTNIEQELNNINMNLIRKYVSAAPDIDAITATIREYVTAATSNSAIQKPTPNSLAASNVSVQLKGAKGTNQTLSIEDQNNIKIAEALAKALRHQSIIRNLPLNSYQESAAAIKTCGTTKMI
ncbi:hypothetical protein [Pseudoalteromonas sp. MEBiC 03485]|uniref:hypothetical protein n=1 Tax=Pseudoalteromonas sp. MEBiC 03485 TaxID=2571103 RepID=UPI001020D822|nr:hypothetical protein [Pseudoalteromonas sp. MEBiC 03485]RZD19743.1 hypothetical protein EVU92_21305 [Pseudoalteromonas sp. MEBiC 03485]